MSIDWEVHRRPQIQSVLQQLERGEWCSVIAPRFSGKSTFARQLSVSLSEEHPAWQIVSVEFQAAGTLEKAWAQVRNRLAGSGDGSGRSEGQTLADELARISHRGLWERRFPLAEVSSWGGLDPDGIKKCLHSAWKLG